VFFIFLLLKIFLQLLQPAREVQLQIAVTWSMGLVKKNLPYEGKAGNPEKISCFLVYLNRISARYPSRVWRLAFGAA